MNIAQRWKASAGYPFKDRVIYSIPMSWLTGTAAAINHLAALLAPIDEICRRAQWRRKHYGFCEYIARIWRDRD